MFTVIYRNYVLKATRDQSWPGEHAPFDRLPKEIRQAIIDFKKCLDETKKFPEICMEIINQITIHST